MVTPTQREYGFNRSMNEPVNSWFFAIGIPCNRFPSATPIRNGASRLLAVLSPSQFRRHAGLSRLLRYSIDRPRAMSAAKSTRPVDRIRSEEHTSELQSRYVI